MRTYVYPLHFSKEIRIEGAKIQDEMKKNDHWR